MSPLNKSRKNVKKMSNPAFFRQFAFLYKITETPVAVRLQVCQAVKVSVTHGDADGPSCRQGASITPSAGNSDRVGGALRGRRRGTSRSTAGNTESVGSLTHSSMSGVG